MKKFFKITKAIILKAVAAVLLPILFIFNAALKAFTFVFRFVALPTVAFGLLITAVTFFDNGYSTSLLHTAGILLGIVVAYFLLPQIPQYIGHTQLRMKNYVFSPIVVRSPVKFTL